VRLVRPELRLLAGAQFLSSLGSAMLLVGITYTAYSDSKSIFRTVLVTSVYLLPTVALSYWAGQVVGRHPVVQVLTAGNSAKVVLYSALTAATAAGVINANTLLIFSFINGCATPFIFPAWQVYEHGLVPDDELSDLNARWESIISVGTVLGTGLAGLILAAAGPAWNFGIDALTYVPFIFAIRHTPSPYQRPRQHQRVAVRTAVDHVMATPVLKGALLQIAVMSLLFAPVVQIIPAIADRVHPGSDSYGGLMAVMSAGAAFVAWRLAQLRRHHDHAQLQRRALVMSGLFMLLLGLAGSRADPLPLGLAVGVALFGVGLLVSLTRAVIMAVIQISVDAEIEPVLLAMVGAVSSVFIALGGILMGVAAQYLDVFAVVAVIGLLLLAFALAVVLRSRRAEAAPA
jgi:MFS family permease